VTGINMIPIYHERGLMASVLVRGLDDDVLKQLKASAKAHGRSLQAESMRCSEMRVPDAWPKRDASRLSG